MTESAPTQADDPRSPDGRGAVIYDSHVHTHFCHHAAGDLDDYAVEAYANNLRGFIFTCHSPLPIQWAPSVRMAMEELPHYQRTIEQLQVDWGHVLDIRLGLECDYVPHHPEVIEPVIGQLPLDYVLGSVHPQFDEYLAQYYFGVEEDFQAQYFRHLADAAESGYFHAISHPDLVRELFPDSWDLQRQLPHIREMLDRVAATSVALELNTSSLFRAFGETSPGPAMLAEMAERQIPVVLGSDAHQADCVAREFHYALRLLRELGYHEICHFLHGKKQTLPIERALASLPEPLT